MQIQLQLEVFKSCNTENDGHTAVYVAAIQIPASCPRTPRTPSETKLGESATLLRADPDCRDPNHGWIQNRHSSSAELRTVRSPRFFDRTEFAHSKDAGNRASRVAGRLCSFRRPSGPFDDGDRCGMRDLGNAAFIIQIIEPSSPRACGGRPVGRYALDALDLVVGVKLVAIGYFEARSGSRACDWCESSTTLRYQGRVAER